MLVVDMQAKLKDFSDKLNKYLKETKDVFYLAFYYNKLYYVHTLVFNFLHEQFCPKTIVVDHTNLNSAATFKFELQT